MSTKLKHRFALIIILFIAILFRFIGLDWDHGQHLHPDERFLTMVGNAMHTPTSFSQYLNPQLSPMNPLRIGYAAYVYGTFPVVLNKIIAVQTNNDNYSAFTLQGRLLSAFFDLLMVFVVLKIVKLWEKVYHLDPVMKYYAAFFYAITVLPIQLSHFFAVDTFLTFFMLSAFYYAMAFFYRGKLGAYIASAVSLGLAFGTKISAIYILPLILCFILGNMFLRSISSFRHKKALSVSLKPLLIGCLLFIGYSTIVYGALRIADPYIFQDANFLNPHIDPTFIQNIKQQSAWGNNRDAVWYPPAVQWIHKPAVLYSLINLAVFGIGLPYFLLLIIGIIITCIPKDIFKQASKHNQKFHFPLLVVSLWVLGFFLYQSTQFIKAMRYMIFLYPFFAIAAAAGFWYLTRHSRLITKILLILLVSAWPLSYISIYTHPNSRVAASEWIYNKIPSNSVILTEYWDDALPLPLQNNQAKFFSIQMLPVFEQDTPDKWQRMNSFLSMGDYYILSSNRGWGTIPTVPESFPLMTKYYADLFSGKNNYKKVAEFTSYPSFPPISIINSQFKIPIPDDWADESFTVYDHPKVLIFKKTTH